MDADVLSLIRFFFLPFLITLSCLAPELLLLPLVVKNWNSANGGPLGQDSRCPVVLNLGMFSVEEEQQTGQVVARLPELHYLWQIELL